MDSTELSRLLASYSGEVVYVKAERPDGSHVYLPVTGVESLTSGILLTTEI